MARMKRHGRASGPEALWAETKRLCRLSDDDVRKAKALWLRELYSERFPDRTPLDEEIEQQDNHARLRQRQFRDAARSVAREFGKLDFVQRVLLFGSVARPLERETPRFRHLRRAGVTVLHDCKDVDLAAYVTDISHLRQLQRARVTGLQKVQEQKQIGVAHHQVDVFLFDAVSDQYLGRLCNYRECPADKQECLVPGCGSAPYLQQHEGFALDHSKALAGAERLHPPVESGTG